MSEMVPNLLERQAFRQQASSAGVAKGMWAMLSKRKSQRPESFGNNGPGGTASQRLDGRLHRKKDLAIFRGTRTPVFQVAEDGLTDRFDQADNTASDGPLCAAPRLNSSPNPDFPASVSGLHQAHAINSKQEQHGRIPEILRATRVVGSCYHSLHIVPRRTRREALILIHARRLD